jgi:hypothetical protein
MRIHQPTLDYVRRRIAEGKSKREIICCLKRFVAREILAISAVAPKPSAQCKSPLDLYRSIGAVAAACPSNRILLLNLCGTVDPKRPLFADTP